MHVVGRCAEEKLQFAIVIQVTSVKPALIDAIDRRGWSIPLRFRFAVPALALNCALPR